MRTLFILFFLDLFGWGQTNPCRVDDSALSNKAHKTIRRFVFDQNEPPTGWAFNADIQDLKAGPAGLHFRATGADPMFISPAFEAFEATDNQCLILEWEADDFGYGEVFYTNVIGGRHGGFKEEWKTGFLIAPPNQERQLRQTRIWPLWSKLGRIVRIRIDPPSGVNYRLVSITITEEPPIPLKDDYRWKGNDLLLWWRMNGVDTVEPAGADAVRIGVPHAFGMLMTPVPSFDAASRGDLRVQASGAASVAFYWQTKEGENIHGAAVPIFPPDKPTSAGIARLDLRNHPRWKGTITHIGVGPTTDVITIEEIQLNSATDQPQVAPTFFGPMRPINRAGEITTVRLEVENMTDKPFPARPVELRISANPISERAGASLEFITWNTCDRDHLPAIEPGQRREVWLTATPERPGYHLIAAGFPAAKGIEWPENFRSVLRIDPPLPEDISPCDHVPEPRPVQTDYEIGVYYFPGWSRSYHRWQYQTAFPERNPVLGYYGEGDPQVADWHIKWAAENGIHFFVYDWYWLKGEVALADGLEEGLLKARYRDRLKFCIMWANHAPFMVKTTEEMLTVTDYWIKHYFHLPNYYRIDDRLYVGFFSVPELLKNLGSVDNIRATFAAMREQVRAAGLGELYLTACSAWNRHEQEQCRQMGFDALTAYNYAREWSAANQLPYEPFQRMHEAIWRTERRVGQLAYLPLLSVGWDARPWHGSGTMYYFDRRTSHFENGLRRLKKFLDETGGRVGILEAWNEWGEGSYLEPSAEYGFDDLEALRRVFAKPGNWPINIGPDDVGLGPYDIRWPVRQRG